MEKIPKPDRQKEKAYGDPMSKKSISIVSILVLLVGFYFLFKEFSLPRFISNRLTSMMKVYVSLGGLDFTFNDIQAEDLVIKNPKGFRLSTAMSIEKLAVSVPLTAFFKEEVIIDSLQLDNIYVGLEFESQSSKKGNWTAIMNNLKSAEPKNKDSTSNKHVIIKKCVLTNLRVEQAYTTGTPPAKFYPTIARLEINNLDSRNGLPLQEISQAILNATLQQIFSQENIKNMLESYLLKPTLPFSVPFIP